jgi:hypothetical protein
VQGGCSDCNGEGACVTLERPDASVGRGMPLSLFAVFY